MQAYSDPRRSPAQIADDIAANPFAWPGGYERWAITDDGGQLCYRCCAAERAHIADSAKGDGWHVVDSSATCEVDNWSTCDNCGADLPGTAAADAQDGAE